MKHGKRTVPCWHCTKGEVSFFRWFHDAAGVIHFAETYGKKVFAKCSNPDCPGPAQDADKQAA